MKTSITTFQEKIQGDLEFPIMTDYGIIDDYNLGRFLRLQSELGNVLLGAQVNALKNFVETGKTEGWYNRLLYVMPMMVLSNKKSVAIPLIANAGGMEAATVGVTEQGYDVETDYDQFITENQKGITSVRNKALTIHLSSGDLYRKSSKNYNRDSSHWGFTLFGKYIVEPNTRFFGCADGYNGYANRLGINATPLLDFQQFGQQFSSPSIIDMLDSINYFNGHSTVVGSDKMIKFDYGDLYGVVQTFETGIRENTVISDITPFDSLRIALNAAWRTDGTIQDGATGQEIYFIAFHDGAITELMYPGYRMAIKNLMQSLGK